MKGEKLDSKSDYFNQKHIQYAFIRTNLEPDRKRFGLDYELDLPFLGWNRNPQYWIGHHSVYLGNSYFAVPDLFKTAKILQNDADYATGNSCSTGKV